MNQKFLMCVLRNEIDCVGVLLDTDIKPRIYKNAPIKHAAAHGYAELIQMLINAGAKVNIEGDAPIQLAVRNNHADATRVLINNGARVTGGG